MEFKISRNINHSLSEEETDASKAKNIEDDGSNTDEETVENSSIPIPENKEDEDVNRILNKNVPQTINDLMRKLEDVTNAIGYSIPILALWKAQETTETIEWKTTSRDLLKAVNMCVSSLIYALRVGRRILSKPEERKETKDLVKATMIKCLKSLKAVDYSPFKECERMDEVHCFKCLDEPSCNLLLGRSSNTYGLVSIKQVDNNFSNPETTEIGQDSSFPILGKDKTDDEQTVGKEKSDYQQTVGKEETDDDSDSSASESWEFIDP